MVHVHLSTSVHSAQIYLTANLWFSSAHHTSATSKPANQPFTRYHFVAQIHVLREFHNLWLSVGVTYGGVTNTMQWCGCGNWKHWIRFKSFVNWTYGRHISFIELLQILLWGIHWVAAINSRICRSYLWGSPAVGFWADRGNAECKELIVNVSLILFCISVLPVLVNNLVTVCLLSMF
jgi:hypothetical protein